MIRSILMSLAGLEWSYPRWIWGQIDEEGTVADTAAFFKVLLEEPRRLHIDTHGSEDDGEVVFVTVVYALGSSGPLDETCLTADLGGDLGMIRQCIGSST